jgi:hypothetical protein
MTPEEFMRSAITPDFRLNADTVHSSFAEALLDDVPHGQVD